MVCHHDSHALRCSSLLFFDAMFWLFAGLKLKMFILGRSRLENKGAIALANAFKVHINES